MEQEGNMIDTLKLAQQQLLEPGGLDQRQLERVLGELMGPAVDAGDLYFQTLTHESWVLEDGLVRSGSHATEQGVGIRAISGDRTGFAYADEIVLPSLLQASGAARAIAREGGGAACRRGKAGGRERFMALRTRWRRRTPRPKWTCCARSTSMRAPATPASAR
jgi:TldD protein